MTNEKKFVRLSKPKPMCILSFFSLFDHIHNVPNQFVLSFFDKKILKLHLFNKWKAKNIYKKYEFLITAIFINKNYLNDGNGW